MTEWSTKTRLASQLARLVLFHDTLLIAVRAIPQPERAGTPTAFTFERLIPLNMIQMLEPEGAPKRVSDAWAAAPGARRQRAHADGRGRTGDGVGVRARSRTSAHPLSATTHARIATSYLPALDRRRGAVVRVRLR